MVEELGKVGKKKETE